MSNYVKNIEITGLYERFDLWQSFYPGVNILYGKNGTGKTTLLNILANALNGDHKRFAFLSFEEIKIELDDGVIILIHQEKGKGSRYVGVVEDVFIVESQINGELLYSVMINKDRNAIFRDKGEVGTQLPLAYFPAFRAMIEAWSSVEFQDVDDQLSIVDIDWKALEVDLDVLLSTYTSSGEQTPSDLKGDILEIIHRKASPSEFKRFGRNVSPDERLGFARSLLGEFVPELNYLSIAEVQTDILYKLHKFNQENKYTDLGISPDFIAQFELFLTRVNSFLEGKELTIGLTSSDGLTFIDLFGGRAWEEGARPLKLKLGDNGAYESLNILSSGERQIVTMLYATNRMSKQKLILIDEPEISFHVDWQERLLKEMYEQDKNRQIIVCTHSPMIGVEFEDRMMGVRLTPMRNTKIDDE
jgi:predicted ATPase